VPLTLSCSKMARQSRQALDIKCGGILRWILAEIILLGIIGSFTVLICIPAWSMEKTDAIDTNRPSFMFSPLVVPQGSLQLENGVQYKYFQHGRNFFNVSETQVRLGLLKNTEFQMFVPNFVLLTTRVANAPDQVLAGVSDLQEVGFKQQIPFKKLPKLSLSVVGSVNIPTGRRFISGPGVQPVIRIPYGYALGKYSLMGMQTVAVINSGRDVVYSPDAMITRAVGNKTSVFIEYLGVFTHQAPSINIAHFGAEYKPRRNHEVDLHFGFGLNKTAPAAFVGAGYSYRFDGLPWGNN